MKELISVVIPVHNAEKYLDECIKSIVGQTYQNLEIILVDDCSTDASPAICDAYAGRDSRVKVLHRTVKGGEGGAKARNQGIAEAAGTVMYFMDSDDYIEPDMLEKMYDRMCQEQSDCVISSFHYVDDKGTELPWYTPQSEKYSCMSGQEAAKVFLTTLDIEGFSWNKLIRRSLVEEQQIRFDESMNSFVDMYNMFCAVLYSRRVSFYPARPYYYRQHNVSCVHTMTKRKLDNFKRVVGQIVALSEKCGMKEESEIFYCYRMIFQMYDAVKAKKSYDKETWKLIQKEFGWSVLFKRSMWKVYREVIQYSETNKLKDLIKLVAVRIWVGG